MTTHIRELSDQLDLPDREEIFFQSYRDEPKGWLCRPEGSTDVPKPVMLWAACERIREFEVGTDREPPVEQFHNPPRPVNAMLRQKSFEIRPVIDLGGGVLGIVSYPVELVRERQ